MQSGQNLNGKSAVRHSTSEHLLRKLFTERACSHSSQTIRDVCQALESLKCPTCGRNDHGCVSSVGIPLRYSRLARDCQSALPQPWAGLECSDGVSLAPTTTVTDFVKGEAAFCDSRRPRQCRRMPAADRPLPAFLIQERQSTNPNQVPSGGWDQPTEYS